MRNARRTAMGLVVFVGGLLGGTCSHLLLCSGVVEAVGQAPASKPTKVIRASRFEVVDGAGKVRAVLGLTESKNSVALGLYDNHGDRGAILGIDPKALTLSLFDGPKKASGGICVEAGRSVFQLTDPKGQIRASLGVWPDGTPKLRLHDAKGQRRADLAIQTDGVPYLNLADSRGHARAVIHGGSPETGAGVALQSGSGKVGVLIAVEDKGADLSLFTGPTGAKLSTADAVPMLRLYDDLKAAPTVSIMARGPLTKPGILFLDKAGKPIWRTP